MTKLTIMANQEREYRASFVVQEKVNDFFWVPYRDDGCISVKFDNLEKVSSITVSVNGVGVYQVDLRLGTSTETIDTRKFPIVPGSNILFRFEGDVSGVIATIEYRKYITVDEQIDRLEKKVDSMSKNIDQLKTTLDHYIYELGRVQYQLGPKTD